MDSKTNFVFIQHWQDLELGLYLEDLEFKLTFKFQLFWIWDLFDEEVFSEDVLVEWEGPHEGGKRSLYIYTYGYTIITGMILFH